MRFPRHVFFAVALIGSLAFAAASLAERSGMLPARWTPAKGPSQPVPFWFEASTATTGRLVTTLGRGGERFIGQYAWIDGSGGKHEVEVVYGGWYGAEWGSFTHDAEGDWSPSVLDVGGYTTFFRGKVVATLTGNQGHKMRCQFVVKKPEAGLFEHAEGKCQTTDAGRLEVGSILGPDPNG